MSKRHRSSGSNKYEQTTVQQIDAEFANNDNIDADPTDGGDAQHPPPSKKSKSSSKLTTRTRREAAKGFHTFSTNITERAQFLLHSTLPNKILSLQKLIQELPVFTHALPAIRPTSLESLSSTTSTTPSTSSTSLPSINNPHKRTYDTFQGHDPVPVHPLITSHTSIIKSEVLTHVEIMSILKLWIQLNMPAAEDGGNFGVGVQEEVVGEITRAEEMGFSILESFNKYWMTRAKLASKVLKWVGIADYWESIRALDETQYLDMKLTLIDLRNSFSVVFDMLIKNEEKIKDPRGTNHSMSMI